MNGLTSAKACSQSGMESTGTNADEAKVSGKTRMKPIAWADSGDDEISAMQAKIHEKA